jgi:hypothetical protein
MRFKAAVSVITDLAKVVGLVVGSFGLAGGAVHCAVWVSNRADAREVVALRSRQDVAETKAENEAEWRRWMVGQVSAISRRVGAPVAPPPVIGTPNDAFKVDAPR